MYGIYISMYLYGTHTWNNAPSRVVYRPKETNVKLPLLQVHRHILSFILPTHGCSFIHSIPPLSGVAQGPAS